MNMDQAGNFTELSGAEIKHRDAQIDIKRQGGPDSDRPQTQLSTPDKKMSPTFFSYSPKTTSISFPWPSDVTGLERIALSAQGDLQRVLSAFFARPISIALVYSHTNSYPTPNLAVPFILPNPGAISAASPDSPIVQTRQVHLQCSGKIVCTATSTVRITSPKCAHLFLEEKYAIGQMFSRMEKIPAFELLSVGSGSVDSGAAEKRSPLGFLTNPEHRHQLWRKYRLYVPDFECEILEVFPSRDMFTKGECWLDEKQWVEESSGHSVKEMYLPTSIPRPQMAVILFLGLGFLLMMAFELSMFFIGRSPFC